MIMMKHIQHGVIGLLLLATLFSVSGCNAARGALAGAASSAAMSAVSGRESDDILRDAGVGAVGGATAGFVYDLF